jgi:hypothetical protein
MLMQVGLYFDSDDSIHPVILGLSPGPQSETVQTHVETISDIDPAMSAVPFADDTLMRLQKLA